MVCWPSAPSIFSTAFTNIPYLRSSAEHGNQYAQYTLGKLYLLGREVERDKDRAVDYLSRSAAQGNVYA